MNQLAIKNKRILEILEKQMHVGRLAHAYLFLGPKGSGKKELVEVFATKVLQIPIENENNIKSSLLKNPDYLEFSCLADTDEQVKNIREFIGKISLKPFMAKNKFVLITNIENLNIHSANSLLKILEEPPLNTVIVLLANFRQILPTIVSRCQVFNINRGTERGSEESRNRTRIKSEENLNDLSISYFSGKSLAERLNAINKFAELEDNEFRQIIEDFIYMSAEKLSVEPQKYIHLSLGLKAFADLKTNKNKKFIMQGLMLKI